jgi:hypothetical protein
MDNSDKLTANSTLFYPTALYAILLQRNENEVREREESGGPGAISGERTPLLPS